MSRKPPQFIGTPLPSEQHEQFARCLAQGNYPVVCYIGVGNNADPEAALMLANSKEVRRRAEEIFRQKKPFQYREHGYKHITEKMNART